MNTEKLETDLKQYQQDLKEVIALLQWADAKLATIPKVFHSAIYSSGTWQTRVDLGVAIENFKRLSGFLETIDMQHFTDKPIIIHDPEEIL